MPDSTTLLIVSVFASCAIGALLYLWLQERANRNALHARHNPRLHEEHIDLISKIADGSAHPLAAWRLGAGYPAETIAGVLHISVQDLREAEAGADHTIDQTSLAALIAASAPLTVSLTPVGAPVIGSADAPSSSGTDGTSSGGSVSDAGGAGGGGAM